MKMTDIELLEKWCNSVIEKNGKQVEIYSDWDGNEKLTAEHLVKNLS